MALGMRWPLGKAAQPGVTALLLSCSDNYALLYFILLWSIEMFLVFVSSPAREIQSSLELESVLSSGARGELTYIVTSLHPWSLIGPFSCK